MGIEDRQADNVGAGPPQPVDFAVVGLKAPDDSSARYHFATPGYFTALGVSLLEGRLIDERDSSRCFRQL